MNIMDAIRPLLSGNALESASRFVGEGRDSTRRALETAVPASIVGIADNASDGRSAEGLLDQFRRGAVPQLDPADFGKTLSDPTASEGLSRGGGGFLQGIMGNKFGSLVDGIAGSSGVGRGAASKLLGLAGPLVLGVIGKHAMTKRLDGRGFARYLGGQRSLAAALLPASIGAILGMGQGGYAHHLEHAPKRGVAKWVPWALAALAVILGLSWLSQRRERRRRAERPGVERISRPEVTRDVDRPPPATPQASPEVAKPQAPQATAPAGPEEAQPVAGADVSAKLERILESKSGQPQRLELKGVEFAAGSAVLDEDAKASLSELGEALKAHPDAKVKIEGHADATGSTEGNMRLAEARAKAAANFLVQEEAISADRVSSEGKGAAEPRMSNTTETQRGADRRVEVLVQP